jgi:hypothetical protein
MQMSVVGKPHGVREAGNQEAMDDEESTGRGALVWVVSTMSTSVQVKNVGCRCVTFKEWVLAVRTSEQRNR